MDNNNIPNPYEALAHGGVKSTAMPNRNVQLTNALKSLFPKVLFKTITEAARESASSVPGQVLITLIPLRTEVDLWMGGLGSPDRNGNMQDTAEYHVSFSMRSNDGNSELTDGTRLLELTSFGQAGLTLAAERQAGEPEPYLNSDRPSSGNGTRGKTLSWRDPKTDAPIPLLRLYVTVRSSTTCALDDACAAAGLQAGLDYLYGKSRLSSGKGLTDPNAVAES